MLGILDFSLVCSKVIILKMTFRPLRGRKCRWNVSGSSRILTEDSFAIFRYACYAFSYCDSERTFLPDWQTFKRIYTVMSCSSDIVGLK